MTAFYNEINPWCAQLLRNLIAAGQIAPGVVDERSIEDITPDELRGYTQVHLFAGLGGWSLALRYAGWPDNRRIWTASCPCQPFSAAGAGAGFADERHLWPLAHHLVAECRPPSLIGEQVASQSGLLWFDLVRADLEASGYAVGAADLCAAGVGAPHIRQRLYWVAHAERDEQSRGEPCGGTSGRVGRIEQSIPWDRPWRGALAELRVLDDGIARCVEATDAARNAIVPQVAQAFIECAFPDLQ